MLQDTGKTAAARNQALFREVNERMRQSGGAFRVESEDFICECAHDDCFEKIHLSLREYESIRANPRRFFVAPSDAHFVPEAEVVVHKDERYWIVEKRGDDGRAAEKLDPRSRSSAAR